MVTTRQRGATGFSLATFPVGLAISLCAACGGTSDPGGTAGQTETGVNGTAGTTDSSTVGGSTSLPGTDSNTGAGPGPETSVSGSSESSGDASEGTATPTPDGPVDCGGTIYQCGDTEDNDGDGHIDLFDPECTGPCDDDESSFQTGIPGDNVDCIQDCFFDGNSGQGDDGCFWNLTCDPENPGAEINCEYMPGPQCNNMPPETPGCLEFCIPLVPPGCDCFGCCTIQTDEGEVTIFLNSHPDCSFENLDACESCTQNDDCINDCEPTECEVCFGETELPRGCDDNECDLGDPCDANADCPTDYFCYLGCCYPPPPG